MSHELRTPLSAVIGYSEMLEEEAEEAGETTILGDLGKLAMVSVCDALRRAIIQTESTLADLILSRSALEAAIEEAEGAGVRQKEPTAPRAPSSRT